MAQINRGGPSRFFPNASTPAQSTARPSRLNPPAAQPTPQGVSSGVSRNTNALPLPKGGKLPFDIPSGQSRPISPEHAAFVETRTARPAVVSDAVNAGPIIIAMGHLAETVKELIAEMVACTNEIREIRARMESEMQAEVQEEAQELPPDETQEVPQG